ncbi:MAG: hypothetical protein AB7D34_02460 [Sulfurimonas sp.]
MTTKTIEYDDKNGTITLNTYTNDGFLTSSLDLTDEAVALVIEKLFDDYNLDGSGELVIRKSEPNRKIGKIKLK